MGRGTLAHVLVLSGKGLQETISDGDCKLKIAAGSLDVIRSTLVQVGYRSPGQEGQALEGHFGKHFGFTCWCPWPISTLSFGEGVAPGKGHLATLPTHPTAVPCGWGLANSHPYPPEACWWQLGPGTVGEFVWSLPPACLGLRWASPSQHVVVSSAQ